MKENYCKFCGAIISEDKCPNGHNLDFKKMCINCSFCDENMCCINNDVMQTMKSNIINEIQKNNINLGNFSIKDIELFPTPIKSPTKRCSKWELDNNFVESIKNNFK